MKGSAERDFLAQIPTKLIAQAQLDLPPAGPDAPTITGCHRLEWPTGASHFCKAQKQAQSTLVLVASVRTHYRRLIYRGSKVTRMAIC